MNVHVIWEDSGRCKWLVFSTSLCDVCLCKWGLCQCFNQLQLKWMLPHWHTFNWMFEENHISDQHVEVCLLHLEKCISKAFSLGIHFTCNTLFISLIHYEIFSFSSFSLLHSRLTKSEIIFVDICTWRKQYIPLFTFQYITIQKFKVSKIVFSRIH